MKCQLGRSSIIFAFLAIVALPALKGQGGGNGLSFFNSNYLTHGDFVYLGSPNYGFNDKVTVAAWVRWDMVPMYNIVGHESEGRWANLVAIDRHNARDNGQFWLQHTVQNQKFEWAVQTTGGRSSVQSTTSPVQGRWYYVAGVYDGDDEPRLKLYVNGVLEGATSTGVSGSIAAYSAPDRLNFARLPSGYRLFTGTLDEIRIWTSALSQTEIRSQMFTTTTQGSECASYWPLDASSGTAVTDYGPQGANGTFYSALVEVHTFDSGNKSISDEDKSWVVDGFSDMNLHTVAGAGVDENNTIISNLEHELFLSSWGTDPILNDYGNNPNSGMTWYGIEDPAETSQWRISGVPIASTGTNETLADVSDIQGILASKPSSFPSSILRISSTNFSDSDRVLFGYAGGGLTSENADLPSGIDHRLSRVWRMEVHTAAARIGRFIFDVSDMMLGAGYEGDLRLLADNDGNFGDATVVTGEYNSGDSTFIARTLLEDGMYCTLASTSEYNVLPVELDLFTASRLGDVVVLNWRTVTEKNNFGFYVQRAIGATPREWSDIGLVPGSGTVNSPRSYRFVDNAVAGVVWYRLRQVDRDGTIALSDAVSVGSQGAARDMRLAMYPNPVRRAATISFVLPESGLVTATIVNTLGSVVNTLCVDRAFGGGAQWLPFDASALSGGVYYLHLRTTQGTASRPVFIVK